MEDTAQLFPSIQGDMPISWKTTQNLRILSKDYSLHMNAMTHLSPNCQEEITADDLKREFPTVSINRFSPWTVNSLT